MENLKNGAVLFKDMPNKTNLKKWINSRLMINHAKITKISTYNKDCCILQAIVKPGQWLFIPSYCKVQSLYNKNNTTIVIIWINNDLHGYGSILSENNFFKRFPESLEKNITEQYGRKFIF